MFLSVIMFASLQRSWLPPVDAIGNARAAGSIRPAAVVTSGVERKGPSRFLGSRLHTGLSPRQVGNNPRLISYPAPSTNTGPLNAAFLLTQLHKAVRSDLASGLLHPPAIGSERPWSQT